MGELKTGRNLYCAIGKETTFGTAVDPTAMLKVTNATIDQNVDILESRTRTGYRATAPGAKVGVTVAGSIESEGDPENLGWYLKGVMGSEVAAQVGATAEYTHTYSVLNSGNLPSFTIETGLGDYRARRFGGIKFNSLALAVEPKNYVTASVELNGKAEVDTVLTFADTDVDTTDNEIDITGHGLSDGDTVRLIEQTGITPPAPLAYGVTYYVVGSATDLFSLSLTSGGAEIDLTDGGSVGNHYIQPWTIIAPSAIRAFTFNDAQIELDDAAFGEVRSANLTLTNNLNTEDYRLNDAGAIASLVGNQFTVEGELSVVFNPASWALVEKYNALTRIKVELNFVSDVVVGSGVYKLLLTIPTAEITAAPIGTEEDGMLVAVSIRGVSASGAPISAVLHNARTTAY